MYKTDSATKQYRHPLYNLAAFILVPAETSAKSPSAWYKKKILSLLLVMTQPAWLREGVMQVPGWYSQLPTAHTHTKKSMWAREMYAVAERPASWLLLFKLPNYSVLQCIACFHECRCMSDGVFIQFVCQVLKFLESRLRSARDLCLYCPWGTKKAFIKACA